jgi:hypothetical protein
VLSAARGQHVIVRLNGPLKPACPAIPLPEGASVGWPLMHCAQIGPSLSSSSYRSRLPAARSCIGASDRSGRISDPRNARAGIPHSGRVSVALRSTLYSDLGSCTTTQLCTTDGIRARELSRWAGGQQVIVGVSRGIRSRLNAGICAFETVSFVSWRHFAKGISAGCAFDRHVREACVVGIARRGRCLRASR